MTCSDRARSSRLPMTQILSVIGAIIILTAYLGVQVKLLAAGRPLFSLLNLVGAALLAYIAVVEEQVGFALLEGAWADHQRLRPLALPHRPCGRRTGARTN